MFTLRSALLATVVAAATVTAGCASTGSDSKSPQYASRDCKAVPATFLNRPKKDASPIEQTEARLKLGRLAAERGGSGGIGNDLLTDLNRECY